MWLLCRTSNQPIGMQNEMNPFRVQRKSESCVRDLLCCREIITDDKCIEWFTMRKFIPLLCFSCVIYIPWSTKHWHIACNPSLVYGNTSEAVSWKWKKEDKHSNNHRRGIFSLATGWILQAAWKCTIASNCIFGSLSTGNELHSLYNRIVFLFLQPSVDWAWQLERLQNNLTGLWGEPEKRQSPPIWSLRTLQQSTVLLPPSPLLTLLIMALEWW